MKFKILLLLSPILMFGQTGETDASKIKTIESHVKYTDSISSFLTEEVSNEEFVFTHGRIDGKPTRRMYNNTRLLKTNGQVIRICYTRRNQETDEDMSFYYSNSKLIYIESIISRRKKKKFIKKRFYYENDILISPTFSSKEYNLKYELEIIEKSRSLLKQASS
ncbi:hypothetical protein [Flavobacterium sp. FlaQc-50]|uniref:hypothetical protein n=1 Tax=unclassified Flavobacterium TaxID=196869 RepID=UPI003757CACB